MSLHEIHILRDVRIPTGDAQVTLSADVFLPVGAERAPAILTVWPYRKDTGIAEPAFLWFAQRGYAGVLVDARGTGSSDGAARPPFDPSEVDDALDVIEWVSTQSWCDGSVGMWGHSYGAMMALRAANRRPAALRAIVPYQCVLDPASELMHPGGERGGMTLLTWGAMTLSQQLLPPLHAQHSVEQQRRWRGRLHDNEPWLIDLFRHGPDDPLWRDRAIDVTSITIPTLVVGGWGDLMCEGTIRAFEGIPAPKKLVMGPWTHSMPHDSPSQPIDLFSLMLRWWDRWLRGIDNGIMDEPQISLFLQGSDPGWRAYEYWPPAKSELVMGTGSGTTLSETEGAEAPASELIAQYTSDQTTGALGGSWWLGSPGLPSDQHDDDMRALSFTSEPLQESVLIAGRPEVRLWLTAPAAGERVVVRLADIDPQGRSTFITSTAARVPANGDPIILWSTAYRIAAGHRVRVVVSDADFPRLFPLPDPTPFQVTKVELIAPSMPEEAGTAIEMPQMEPVALQGLPLVVSGSRRCAVTREQVSDQLDVVVAEEVVAYTPTREHIIELRQQVRAKVIRLMPAAASIEAFNRAVARDASGEATEVTVSARMTGTSLWIRGEISVDSTTTYSRVWESEITDR